MTNLQLYLAIGLPILAILTSLIVSLVQISAIRSDMCDLRVDVKSELKEARAESKAESKEIKASIDLLTGRVYEMMGHRE